VQLGALVNTYLELVEHTSLFLCLFVTALFRLLVPRIVEIEYMRHFKND